MRKFNHYVVFEITLKSLFAANLLTVVTGLVMLVVNVVNDFVV